MSDLNKYIVCDWFFDNNTQVSIDKNKKTITLSIAPDRHQYNVENVHSFDAFLKDNSGMKYIILSNLDIQKKNAAELIIETVTYYASEKYVQDVERQNRESKLCLASFVELKDYQDVQNIERLATIPNHSEKKIWSGKYFSHDLNEVKGDKTIFHFSFVYSIFFKLLDSISGEEIDIKIPQSENLVFYSGFFANSLYFFRAKEQLIVMNELGEMVQQFDLNEPVLNYYRIYKISWLDNTVFIKLSNKIDYSDTIWLAWDYKTGIIQGKVSTIAKKLEVEKNQDSKNVVEKPLELKQKTEEAKVSKGSENLQKKLNDTRTLEIISKIQSQQKNTIIAYGILVFILNLGPTIGIFYNEKAFFFLIPTIILSIILVIQMVKIAKYTLKYGIASIIEITASSTPTNSTYKYSTGVNFVLVNEHILYDAKIDGIDFKQKESALSTKYQISQEMSLLINDKKEISFITKGKNEIASILEMK